MKQKILDELWALIEPIKTGMFQTVYQGKIHSRPMQNIQSEFDGKIWFFSDQSSEKALEIINNPSTSIVYTDPQKGHFVHVSGTSKLVDDAALIEKFWNGFVEMWFPEGKKSERVGLISMNVSHIEYWENHGKISQVIEIAKSKVTGDMPDPGNNEKIEINR